MINVSMLAIKRTFACYQMNFCLLSNELLLAVKNAYACIEMIFTL